MDALRGFGELGIGSRLKRLSEQLMKDTQIVYDYYNVDFDPYLFPIFRIISTKNGVTNTEIQNSLSYTQPAITQAINKLDAKGYILFKSDEVDKRKKIIFLSDKGEKTLNKLKPLWKSIDFVIKDITTHNSNSLIDTINKIENKLMDKGFSETIINHIKMNTTENQIIEFEFYKNEYAKNFYELNIEWLKAFFVVEPYDEDVLSKPDTYIIGKGGHIFFAKINDEIVGTVALMPIGNEGLFELTKMAVSPKHRGKKIGQQLLDYCINYAKDEMGLPKLVLYSNRVLENAIYIYRKYGFVEIDLETNSPYVRSDIKMELVF
ncbi:bifunctional helix-turn-helix transcriptional regulator/GNAT family N-acetyltransferase [Seonamhaeicola marinus]|uniref:GNAT family N-acetyltransferase n=1 Tax=Seonamhaeicola marinus TaxID=1912246 RepID=A0A5D0HR00_9FLAO|nr:bifunctional helix-turn-helix transcriptional regulator/GNAT family N-acetyltransferase [Seonamhaeicola marinus]TYA71812.1 GNAT family N-acetyltransferase [Seonamhaeicola marinus]